MRLDACSSENGASWCSMAQSKKSLLRAVGWHAPVFNAIVVLCTIAGLVVCRSFFDQATENGKDMRAAELLVLPGMLLVLGVFAGRLAALIDLPRLTGYIIIGCVVGPYGPSLSSGVSHHQVEDISVVSDLAIGLIALLAGAEIRIAWVKKRLSAVSWICGMQSFAVPLLVMGVVWLTTSVPFFQGLLPAWPFLAADMPVPAWMMGLLLGSIVVASSPTVVVSVIKDTNSSGSLSETIMGAAVAKDLCVIVLFTILLAIIGKQQVGGAVSNDHMSVVLEAGTGTLGSLLLSLALGAVIGFALRVYTEKQDRRLSWIIVGLALAISALSTEWHIKPLFCLLAAGFVCENIGARSAVGRHRLEHALNVVTGPVFVLFFVATGLHLDLPILAHVWPLVIVLFFARNGMIYLTTTLGSRLGGMEPQVQRYAWMGLIPQAGVTLALAEIISSGHGDWGKSMSTLIVALVAVHELIGPIALTWALRRCGESKA